MLQKLLAAEQATALDEFLSPSGSFCWLVILLAMFALFYLIFCSYYKVDKLVKLIGWVYSAFMIAGDIIILAVKLDIFTLGSVLFSLMLFMAILSIVLPSAGTNNVDERKAKSEGCYVVREMESGRTCFELYDKNNKFIVRSCYSYNDVPQVMEQIIVSRMNGEIATLQDRTGEWVEQANHPKFELYREDEKYYFHLAINGKYVIFKSEGYSELSPCKKMLEKAMKAVLSEKVYLSVEKLNDAEAGFTAEKCYNVALQATTKEGAVAEKDPNLAKSGDNGTEAEREENAFPNKMHPLWERYAELGEENRNFFDEIRKKARSLLGVKEYEAKDYLAFRLNGELLLKLQIKHGVVQTVLLPDPKVKEHLEWHNNADLKETLPLIKVQSKSYLSVVFKAIDLRYATLMKGKK